MTDAARQPRAGAAAPDPGAAARQPGAGIAASDPGAGPSMPAAGQRPGPSIGHEHAWALMQFELVDDHPVVRQHCATCGLVRRYRAWERYWSPANSTPGR